MPDCVISDFHAGLQKWASDPTTSYETDSIFGKQQESNRLKVAAFLGVDIDNICLTDNTTMGLSMTLMGLSFRPEDRIVTTNHEHMAVRSPLRVLRERIGVRIDVRPFPPAGALSRMNSAELLDALFPVSPDLRGAKALCVSHVYPTTGVRLPLRALRDKVDQLDIQYLIVDGAQAMGMIDLTAEEDDISLADFYACPGHKWLNGPPSTGVLYIRNADIRPPEFYPTISQRMEQFSDWVDDSQSCYPVAKALQVRGCSNAPGFAAMVTAMRFAEEMGGSAQIEKRILALSDKVKALVFARAPHCMVSPRTDRALLSGITTFFPFVWHEPQTVFRDKRTADRVVKELLEQGIQVRSIGFSNSGTTDSSGDRVYAIRVSTGYFNSSDQIEKFADALQHVLRRLK